MLMERPRSPEVPSFALFDSTFLASEGSVGRAMLKVAPHGNSVLRAGTPQALQKASDDSSGREAGYDAVVVDGGTMDISIEYCVT